MHCTHARTARPARPARTRHLPAASPMALPRDKDGFIITSADFGYGWLVKIQHTTDFDGREIDPDKEDYPETLHGPFEDKAEATEWMEAYPEFTDIADMEIVMLNKVRPSTRTPAFARPSWLPVDWTWQVKGGRVTAKSAPFLFDGREIRQVVEIRPFAKGWEVIDGVIDVETGCPEDWPGREVFASFADARGWAAYLIDDDCDCA